MLSHSLGGTSEISEALIKICIFLSNSIEGNDIAISQSDHKSFNKSKKIYKFGQADLVKSKNICVNLIKVINNFELDI